MQLELQSKCMTCPTFMHVLIKATIYIYHTYLWLSQVTYLSIKLTLQDYSVGLCLCLLCDG